MNNNRRIIILISLLFLVIFLQRPVYSSDVANGSIKKYIVDAFHVIYHSSNVWQNTYWLGVPMLQNPCDNHIVQEIISEIKPDFIVETGTFQGGSALFYASILHLLNIKGKIFTVDIKSMVKEAAAHDIFKKYVEILIGSSVSDEIYSLIEKRVKGKKVIVILDSLHTKEHVLQEMILYSKLVPVGSYLIVQDTNVHGHPVLPTWPPGPMEAVEEFLSKNDDFEIDKTKEKFLLTFYPSGYLKRVK